MAKNTVSFSIVSFSKVEPGYYFFYRGEKYLKLDKTGNPSENAINMGTKELLVFGGRMLVHLKSK